MRPGRVVGGRYELLEHLASGGMGSVFRARHLISDRVVALKVMHDHVARDQQAAERFRREARASWKVGHPGLVEVLDAGVDELGALFLAMELLEGEHLGFRLSRDDTTLETALWLLVRAIEPLAAAHAAGIVHRDLKPENVFVQADDSVKLLDFGVAKHLAAASSTLTGTALGTPYYMSPEQVLSAKEVTPAADVWAVGVILYELLAGLLPFDGPTPQAVLVMACTQRPVPTVERYPSAPRLAGLVDACLATDPAERPADGAELLGRLTDAIDAEGPFDAVVGIERFRTDAPTIASDRPTRAVATTPSAAPRRGWRRHTGDGWALEVPPGWRELDSLTPNVALRVGLGHAVARLKIDAWPGTSRAYVELGLERLADGAHMVRTADVRLGGQPALEAEAVHPSADPPTHTIRRAFALDGRGYHLCCEAPVEEMAGHLPVFKAILASFELTGGAGAFPS